MTKYIYPIRQKIQISKNLNFYLDNPRDEKEIGIIKLFLEKSLIKPDEDSEFAFHLLGYSKEEENELNLLEIGLDKFNNYYADQDSYLGSFFEQHRGVSVFEKLARMWVIARYDDEGEFEKIKDYYERMKDEGTLGIIMLDKGNPIVDSSENLINYTYLLSLLFHSDENCYYGDSFILHHNTYALEIPKIDRIVNKAVFYFVSLAYSNGYLQEEDKWHSFFHIKDKLIEVGSKLDNVIEDSNKDKILFIANLLRTVGDDINDGRYKLVTLVSVIELLLTHNPDHSKFNVEDSISKQFRLKASILVYQNNKTKKLDWIKDRLKDIYTQRSNIAHGNFKSFKEYLKKEIKKSREDDIDEDIIISRLIEDIYKFIRAIIEEYIIDRQFVDFLKEN